jgi:beta-glucuronidase
MLWIAALTILLLILIAMTWVWRHLFFRDAFTPPNASTTLQIQSLHGTPFLIENGLPYPSGVQSTNREILTLDGEWRFYLENAPEASIAAVPHCFNTADSALRDFQGAVIYERDFTIAALPPAWTARLAFLGSFYRTTAWLDGRLLGEHCGGYLPFYFDLSSLVTPGQTHHLKVRVDNTVDSTSLPARLFQGHNIGWHPYGGLHRSVLVEICPPQYCFKLQVETNSATEEGLVQVCALLHRPGGASSPLDTASLRIYDGQGGLLAETQTPVVWDAAAQYGAAQHTFSIARPKLWAPLSPTLYQLEIETRYERCQTSFGFRSLRAQDGKLWLNEKPIILKGICRHQEDRHSGLAHDLASIKCDLQAIQSLNANFVRLAHYPHSAETLDLCDQMGLCAWEEIPFYQVGLGLIRFLFDKTKYDTGKAWGALPGVFRDTAMLENPGLLGQGRDELLKLIERDRNHPSILFWGLGNECWSLHPSGEKALAWLRQQAEGFDPSRLFSYAAFTMPVLTERFERSFNVVDVISVNEYFGWYYGKTQEAGPFLQALARKFPGKPLLVTETGADALHGRHAESDPPPRYSEEYQADLLEQQWRLMHTAATFSGLSIWVLKDFLCPEYREDNPLPFYNLKGLIDRDRQPKAAFERVKQMYGQ